MSNLFKSGFVAFTKDEAVVIDANKNKIIEGIDANARAQGIVPEQSEEDALAAAMIEDVGLYDEAEEESVLTIDTPLFDSFNEFTSDEAKVKASEIIQDANQEAEDIVKKAHDEAEQIRATAFDEAQQIKQQAQSEGFEEGYSQGKKQAEREIEAMKQELETQMEENQIQFQQDQESLLASTEQSMLRWLCEMIPNIVGITVEGSKNVLLYMINKALNEQESSDRYIIRVSSEDYGLISERKSEIYGALNPSIELEVFEDTKLAKNQCQIDTDNGIVDLSLDVQIDNIIKALRLMSIK